jgi:mono/diheme cytochrome c family protein/glucose/arabinose dehydrogenase
MTPVISLSKRFRRDCLHLGFLTLALACNPVIAASSFAPPPVHSPGEELGTFRLAEAGCRIELVASEPMIEDPVALAFDGRGRLWVAEMRGFMLDIDRKDVDQPSGRVSVLEDLDGDGRMDKSTVFLDGLILPRSIAIHPDGVLIAENKALWFARDLDGDLIADEKTLVDPKYAKNNIEHSANGLLRAMDNRIYNAKEGHRYQRRGDQWIREQTEARGQWGICQDDWGRLFYNYNHSQLHADLVPPNALSRNPNHEPSTGLNVGVAHSNRVFPIRPTPAANRAYIPGALDEAGRIKEFTSACAPMIYRGALIPEFAGNAFVCDTVGNLIKRNVLTDEDLTLKGSFPYPDRELLASTDERFRPVALTTGPEGAIYIADMYRGVIQDGPHMSPYLREHSIARKMDQPIHLGRVWRVVPIEFQQPPAPRFDTMTPDALGSTLAHPNGWWRDTAQMHLVERELISAVPALLTMADTERNPIARLHALWTLEGLRHPKATELLPLLRDPSPRVVAAALRVLASLNLPEGDWPAEITRLLSANPSDEVALQLLFTLGDLKLDESRRLDAMHRLLMPRVENPLMRDAALSSLSGREAAFLKLVLARVDSEQDPFLGYMIESLSAVIVRTRDARDITWILARLDSEADWIAQALWNGISVNAPDLLRQPVKLTSIPKAREKHPRVKHLFAWPGHQPEPPKKTDARTLTKDEAKDFARGRQIYLTACVACHASDGRGMKMLAPPLAGSDWVLGGEQRLVRILLHGLSGGLSVSGRHYAAPEIQPEMPPLAVLSNSDIAAILTYIRREWDNAAEPVTERTVNRLRIETQGRTKPWTEAELAPYATLAYPTE